MQSHILVQNVCAAIHRELWSAVLVHIDYHSILCFVSANMLAETKAGEKILFNTFSCNKYLLVDIDHCAGQDINTYME